MPALLMGIALTLTALRLNPVAPTPHGPALYLNNVVPYMAASPTPVESEAVAQVLALDFVGGHYATAPVISAIGTVTPVMR